MVGKKQVEVFARNGWQRVGVKVAPGTIAHIKYIKGGWITHPDKGGPKDGMGIPSSSAGQGYVMPGHPEGGLIARIIGRNAHGVEVSRQGFIGNDGTITLQEGGELELSANDEPDPGGRGRNGFADNSLSITVEISTP